MFLWEMTEQKQVRNTFPILFFIALIGLLHLSIFKNLYQSSWSDHGDGLQFCWNLWWLKEALFHLHQSPYFTSYLFSPTGIGLFLHDLSPLYGLLSIPLQPFLPLEVVYTILTELVFFSAALGAYLLCHEVSGNQRAAIVGGVIYAFSPYILSFPGQLSIISIQWLPLALWAWLRAERVKQLRYSFYCGLFIVGGFYCCFTHTVFIVMSLGFFSILELVRYRSFQHLGCLMTRILVVVLCVILLTGPVLYGIFQELSLYGNYTKKNIREAEVNGIDLALTVIPRRDHFLWKKFIDREDRAQWIPIHHNAAFLGYVALLLSCMACLMRAVRRKAWPWAMFGLIMLVLSLGPSLLIAGRHPFGSFHQGDATPLPFYYLTTLPILSAMRCPSRSMVMVFCSLSVLASLALTAIIRRATQGPGIMVTDKKAIFLALFAPWLLCVLILIDNSVYPRFFPVFNTSPVFSALSESNDGKTILYLPIIHLRDFLTEKEHYFSRQIMFFQTSHHHPYTSGHVSRRPSNENLMLPKPYLLSVIESIQNGASREYVDTQRLRHELPFALNLLDVDTIVFDKIRFPCNQAPTMLSVLYEILPVPATIERENIVVWRIPDKLSQARETHIDFLSMQGTDAVGPLSQIIVMKPGTPVVHRNEMLTLSLPGDWSGPFTIEIDCDLPSVSIAVTLSDDGDLLIQEALVSGHATLSGTFSRRRMNTVRKIQLLLHEFRDDKDVLTMSLDNELPMMCFSAGMDAGNEAWIQVGPNIVHPSARGYFFVTTQRGEGLKDQSISFDTHGSPEESMRMANWLSSLAEGVIVLGCILDEGSGHLTGEAVESLKSIGCKIDIRGKYRWSHAFIGKKGRPPGTAIESSSIGASCVHSTHGVKVPLRGIYLSLPDNP